MGRPATTGPSHCLADVMLDHHWIGLLDSGSQRSLAECHADLARSRAQCGCALFRRRNRQTVLLDFVICTYELPRTIDLDEGGRIRTLAEARDVVLSTRTSGRNRIGRRHRIPCSSLPRPGRRRTCSEPTTTWSTGSRRSGPQPSRSMMSRSRMSRARVKWRHPRLRQRPTVRNAGSSEAAPCAKRGLTRRLLIGS